MASDEIGKSRQARWRVARALRWASELGAGSALAGLRLMKRRRALQGIGLLGSRWRVELMLEARTDCGKFLVTTAAHSAEGHPLARYPRAEEYQTMRSVLSEMPCPAINSNFREQLFKDVNTALNRTFYQARSPTAIDLYRVDKTSSLYWTTLTEIAIWKKNPVKSAFRQQLHILNYVWQ
jgi:hypothetical protein